MCVHGEHKKYKGMAYKVFLSAASWHRPQLLFAVDNDGEQWKGEPHFKPD